MSNEKLRVLFLDIDGVLNIMSDSYRSMTRRNPDVMEPHLVSRLNYIASKVGNDFRIVITSSWGINMANVCDTLIDNGFTYIDRVIDRTSRLEKRGDAIIEWVNENEHRLESYCVVDDKVIDICGAYNRGMQARYVVECDMAEGLSENNVDRILGILGDV